VDSFISYCSVHVRQPDADFFRLALFVANAIDLTSISTLGSAGFLLIFAAVKTANAFHAPQTNSPGWISAAGACACLAALVAMAVMIESSYRLVKREIRIHE